MTPSSVPTTPATRRRAASIRTTQPRAATGTPARPTTGAAGGGAWAARHPTATMGTSVRRTPAIRRRAASTRTTRRPVTTATSARRTIRAEAAGCVRRAGAQLRRRERLYGRHLQPGDGLRPHQQHRPLLGPEYLYRER